MRRLILASASPRRKDLLEEAGFDVCCVVSGAEELESDDLAPDALALENARRKAALVARRYPDDIVLAADTVVWREGCFYGKPADLDDAVRMIGELEGRTHEVVTGVVICRPSSGTLEFAESSRVTFRRLGPDGIRRYLESINPLDKAGGYAAQGDEGKMIIESIDGLLTNVIGLPIERVIAELTTP
jgi:septum formation protein